MQSGKCVVHSRRVYQQDIPQLSREALPLTERTLDQERAIRLFLYSPARLPVSRLRRRLERFEGVTVIGESSDASHAVAMLKCLHVQLVIVNSEEQTDHGIDATRRIKSEVPHLPIMIVSSSTQSSYAQTCLRAGAIGYCLHSSSLPRFFLAVSSVAEGAGWIDPQVSAAVVCPPVALLSDPRSSTTPFRDLPLSDRELQVLRLIAEGMANHEIAAKLVVSPETVKSHVKRIMEKLAASDRTQAVALALRGGLFS